ncbi:MAG: hypothetical protein PHG66_01170 [Candidatus Colwellbacteria bacterium]|nr:hypothetical protein [Candidatus Colwellbacteria bacterium]
MKMKQVRIKHAWSVLCSGVSIDRNSNNASLFNVIEQINAPRRNLIEVTSEDKPELAIPMDMNLVSSWYRAGDDPVSADIKVEVHDPLGNKRELESYHVDMNGDVRRVRLLAYWQGIRASVSGRYIFNLLVREDGSQDFIKGGEAAIDVHILDKGGEEK